MEGDTVINQLTYKKIYCYKTPDLSDRQLLHYACRQDNQKVFIYFYHTQSEVLFFDFSLTNGDLFEEYGRSYQVFYIHDTLLNDGVTRKCIHLKDTTRDDNIKIWVEGIGSLPKGIYWEPFDIVGCTATLLYCQQNGVQIYLNLDAQEPAPSPWFPDGAEWYYGIFNQFELWGGTGCIHMTVAKDTLFAGRPCKQLKLEACDGKYETLYEYVYPCGDSLFYYNYADEDFFLLLDLSAKTGDTIWVHDTAFIPNPGFDPYHLISIYTYENYRFMAYRITGMDTVIRAGKSLRRQYVEPITERNVNGRQETSWWEFPRYQNWDNEPRCIIEGIGSLGGFWGETRYLHLEWGCCKLRCFFAEGKTYMTDGTCTNAAEETPLENPAAFWRLSPQPATESVQAVCEAAETGWHSGNWRLVDAGGKALRRGTFSDGRFDVSLNAIPAGLYFIEITANGTTCHLKCVKR